MSTPPSNPSAHSSPLLLEFLLRDKYGARTEERILLPIHYLWQEGPLDQNIQFERDGDNYWPKLDENEEYLIPDPNSESNLPRIAYHLGIRCDRTLTPEADLLSQQYIKRLKALWHLA